MVEQSWTWGAAAERARMRPVAPASRWGTVGCPAGADASADGAAVRRYTRLAPQRVRDILAVTGGRF